MPKSIIKENIHNQTKQKIQFFVYYFFCYLIVIVSTFLLLKKAQLWQSVPLKTLSTSKLQAILTEPDYNLKRLFSSFLNGSKEFCPNSVLVALGFFGSLHLLTPSGLHFHFFLQQTQKWLSILPRKLSHPYILKILWGLIGCFFWSMAFQPAFRRICILFILHAAFSLSKNQTKNIHPFIIQTNSTHNFSPLKNELFIILLTFIIDALFFQSWKEAPLSFIFSWWFLNLISLTKFAPYSDSENLREHFFYAFFFGSLLISIAVFQPENLYFHKAYLFINIFLPFIIQTLMPILALYFFIHSFFTSTSKLDQSLNFINQKFQILIDALSQCLQFLYPDDSHFFKMTPKLFILFLLVFVFLRRLTKKSLFYFCGVYFLVLHFQPSTENGFFIHHSKQNIIKTRKRWSYIPFPFTDKTTLPFIWKCLVFGKYLNLDDPHGAFNYSHCQLKANKILSTCPRKSKSGNPSIPVQSLESIHSINRIPRDSILQLPAQSKGLSSFK
jgi:hypothetical protein